jgi:hypothetical protein
MTMMRMACAPQKAGSVSQAMMSGQIRPAARLVDAEAL